MSEAALTYRGTVYPWHCDHVGHMNVMWYVGKFDEATWQFFASLGLTPAHLRAEKSGMAAVDQHVAYLREVHAGDVVSVRTTLIEARAKTIRFEHTMTDDGTGEVVARTILTAVHLDTEARKSRTFSPAIAAALATRLDG